MRLTTSSTVMVPMGRLFAVHHCQAAQIVFVENFENSFVVRVGRDGEQRLEGQFGHALIGIGEQQARDGNGAGERGVVVDQDYVVELVGEISWKRM